MARIVLYIMNEKGCYVLDQFIAEFGPDKIEYVVLAKDNNLKDDSYKQMIDLCNKYSIEYKNRSDQIPDFSGYKFAIGWRWLIKDVNNLIVLHDSILPKYRGFAPLVNMLINGEEEIGVSAIFASEKYDRGDIILQSSVSIKYPIKIQEAINMIKPLYAEIVNTICRKIFADEAIIATPQDEEKATYSVWRDEHDYLIDWNADSSRIKRTVDALGYPYAGARTYLNNRSIIIDEVEQFPDVSIENRDPGKVIFIEDGFPVIICGNGLIKIIKARYEDGNSIFPITSFRSRFGM